MVGRRAGWLLAGALGAAAAPVAAGQGRDLWLEAEIEPAQVFVQSQAVYRLRFFQAVDVRDLTMTGPSARLADLRQIGAGRVYEALRDGRRYRVHERSYAVFPFSSGALELSGAHASGRVAAVAASSADGRQAVRLDAAARTLTVRPVPAAAAAAGADSWLPAHALTLTESWSPAAGARTGQALRRSIRIEAGGIDAGQIPPLHVAAPGMMVDAEPARLENRMAGERNIGVREQTFRMVALRGGEILVPALQLRWWDLGAGALASATLPSRNLRVAPAVAETAAAGATAATDATPIPAAPLLTPPLTLPPALPAPRRPLLLAAAAMLFAGIAFACVRRPGVRAAWRLRRACRRGSAGALRDGLLEWAAAVWPQAPPLTLQALAERLPDPAARRALGSIERSLYGPGPCDAAALAGAVRVIRSGSRRWRRQCR